MTKDGSWRGQHAGRVSFEDARFAGADDGVWYSKEPIVLRVLASPKPTTFQHYLIQNRKNGHDPDRRSSLAHYGSSPKKTQIRGYKHYWHKGQDPAIEATAEERKHETQLTRIRPLKAGVRFAGRIRFENLRDEELGALLWALTLSDPAGEKQYRHELGMGKPLGMGAVRIQPRLHLVDSQERYGVLFGEDGNWEQAARPGGVTPCLEAFEAYVLEKLGHDPERVRLADLSRIQMLLTMSAWREGNAEWLEKTRYMEIERQPGNVNEYTLRPVLPDPLAVAGQTPASVPEPTPTKGPASRSKPIPSPAPAGLPTRHGEELWPGQGALLWFHRAG